MIEEKKEVIGKKDEDIVKPYRGYEHEYEIVSNKEDLKKYVGRKLKRAWYNDKKKKCLKSYIYWGDDSDGNIILIEVVRGTAKEFSEKEIIHPDEFFKQSLIFLGYIDDKRIMDELDFIVDGTFAS